MSSTNRKSPETLAGTIRRVIADCRAVGNQCTPELLAQAISTAGWTHRTALVTANDRELQTTGGTS